MFLFVICFLILTFFIDNCLNEPSIESLYILVVNVYISLAMEYIYIYIDAFNILHFLDDVSLRIYLDGLTDLHVYF